MIKNPSSLIERVLALLLALTLGCAAQSSNSDLDHRIERQLRSAYGVPGSVQMVIGPHTPSDITGFESVTVTFEMGDKKQKGEFLVSKDGKTLLKVTKYDLTKDPYVENVGKMDLSGRPVRGNKDAKVTIVNYDDFQCPFCSRMHSSLANEILSKYGDRVKIIYKDFPLTQIHPWAMHAAIDANCLASQSTDAYWSFADYLHANQREITGSQRALPDQFQAIDKIALDQGTRFKVEAPKLQACLKAQSDAAVQTSIKEGDALGISATPTMFINGQKLEGAVPSEEVQATIDYALREANGSKEAKAGN